MCTHIESELLLYNFPASGAHAPRVHLAFEGGLTDSVDAVHTSTTVKPGTQDDNRIIGVWMASVVGVARRSADDNSNHSIMSRYPITTVHRVQALHEWWRQQRDQSG